MPNLSCINGIHSGTLFAGGYFTSSGDQARNGLCSINKTNGTTVSWNPNHSGIVSALFLNGTTLYVAGASSAIDGSPYSLLSIDTTTGSLNFP